VWAGGGGRQGVCAKGSGRRPGRGSGSGQVSGLAATTGPGRACGGRGGGLPGGGLDNTADEREGVRRERRVGGGRDGKGRGRENPNELALTIVIKI